MIGCSARNVMSDTAKYEFVPMGENISFVIDVSDQNCTSQ
jgi:hypothetical protein